MNERERAIKIANNILDVPYKDPDDNMSILARQFLRAIEVKEKGNHPKTEEDWKNTFPLNTFEGETRKQLETMIETLMCKSISKIREEIKSLYTEVGYIDRDSWEHEKDILDSVLNMPSLKEEPTEITNPLKRWRP